MFRLLPFPSRISAIFALTIGLTGCAQVVMLGYMIAGPPSIEPDFDKATGLSMTDLDVTVAVVCYAPNDLKFEFDSLDANIAKFVTMRLHKNHIDVVPADRVRAWLDENPNWDRPGEIGAALDVTYVVYIDVHKFTLYEEESRGEIFRGRAEALLSVYEMQEDETGDKIYSKEVTSIFPLKIGRSAAEVRFTTFQKQFLARFSEEIGRIFYEHWSGDDIADAA